jgi:predicted Zn-dependent protease
MPTAREGLAVGVVNNKIYAIGGWGGSYLSTVEEYDPATNTWTTKASMPTGREYLAVGVFRWRENPEWEAYVTAVGQMLLPHIRRKGIQYEFHVIDWSEINAFALPGGQIFITTGMLEFLQSEAELSAILGHEISHVDLRHCIELFQYELALRKVGMWELGQLSEIARQIFLMASYNKYQELEADAQGVRLSIEAGYNPEAGAAVFNRVRQRFGEQASSKAKTPIGEMTQALEEAMGSYFSSHPVSEERMRRLSSLVFKNRQRLSGHTFYVGAENYRRRIPRAQQEFPGEQRRF